MVPPGGPDGLELFVHLVHTGRVVQIVLHRFRGALASNKCSNKNCLMTSLLAPSIADPLAGVHADLDALAEIDLEQFAGDRLAGLLASVSRGEARLAAFRLKVLARAERARAGAASGAASTGQWAARVVNADPVVAQRQVGLAQGLESRAAARQALSAGVISAEHAAVIVQVDRDLPVQVTRAQREVVEASLVEKAQTLTPTALRRAARRAWEAVESEATAVAAHENDLVLAEEDRARTRTRLSLHDNGDGTVTGHFTVPTAQGMLLKKIIDTITAPRRGRLGATQAQVGDREARTDWDRARGEALVELIEHLPTEHLHPKTAATLVVSLSYDVLAGALKAAGLDTGDSLSADEVRRLACTAHLIPAVLDGKGIPLDLGRSSRLYTEAQRVAVGLLHQTCAADGCDRPFAWCELHHLHAWALGGSTDLANAVPLCHFHHQRIHDHQYRYRLTGGGAIVFERVG